MAKDENKLAVYWGEHPLGNLERFPGGRGLLGFAYGDAWLESGGPPISLSLPLMSGMQDPLTSSNFFENYLPEGDAFGVFALLKHISPGDAFSFLSVYGRECAGALSVLPFGESWEESPPEYRDVTDIVSGQLALPARERLNLITATDSKVSLAGAQNKLPVRIEEGRLLVPAEKSFAATTHIIKAPSTVLPDMQFNEAFCMDLARAVGLPAPETEILEFGGTAVLAAERYDRRCLDGAVRRLHQEDFCQALGLFSQQKYEERQGPGFAACAGVAGKCSDASGARENFARAAVYNLLVGNGDAHGKNFSVIYDWAPELGQLGKGFRLAPFYDIISTLLYTENRVETAMAMRYGKTFRPEEMNSQNLRAMAKDLGIEASRFKELAETMAESVGRNMIKIAEKHSRLFPSADIYDRLLKIIEKQTSQVNKSLDGIKPPTRSAKQNQRKPGH
jgi:serine/threonine-protein kinase HipA